MGERTQQLRKKHNNWGQTQQSGKKHNNWGQTQQSGTKHNNRGQNTTIELGDCDWVKIFLPSIKGEI